VALEFLDILQELLPSIPRIAGYFRLRLEDLARHYAFIKEIRCYGLMIGIELAIPCKGLVEEALNRGLLINCTQERVLRLLPPYILTEADVDRAIDILDKVFRKGREIYVESGLADELIRH